ncbi:MAG: 50S ribosomal protein L10 [Deltaproteobacteria bacterium]|nr:50S ribosomal protein L10 [Deltaproteobacteria bacterium]
MSNLRRQVREGGGEYRVVKNTLLSLAAKGTDTEQLSDLFVGNNALGTTTGDPVPLAKALVEFAKENEELVIKGGILSGKILNFEQIKRIGDLPSREVLLGKLLGTMNAVPTNLVRVFSSIISNFVYALAAIRDQKEQA